MNRDAESAKIPTYYPSGSPEAEAMMRRLEITCQLFEMAYEIKFLELQRRNPDASEEWIRAETLRLIEAGTR